MDATLTKYYGYLVLVLCFASCISLQMPRHGGRTRTASFFLFSHHCLMPSDQLPGYRKISSWHKHRPIGGLGLLRLSESRIAPKPSLLGLMWRPTAAERSKDGTFKSSKHGIKLLWAVYTRKRPVAQYAIPPVALCIFFFSCFGAPEGWGLSSPSGRNGPGCRPRSDRGRAGFVCPHPLTILTSCYFRRAKVQTTRNPKSPTEYHTRIAGGELFSSLAGLIRLSRLGGRGPGPVPCILHGQTKQGTLYEPS